MKPFKTPPLCTAACCALLAAAALAIAPSCLPGDQGDAFTLWNYFLQAERAARLDAGQKKLFRSTEGLHKVRQDLIEHRLTLRQAAAALRAEHESRPADLRFNPDCLPGRSDEERWCRLMTDQIDQALVGDPRRPAVAARLEAELQEVIGTPASPAVPALTAARATAQ